MKKYTTGQAAEYLGLSMRTIKAHIRRGNISATQHETPTGVIWMVTEEELERFQANRRLPGRPRKEEHNELEVLEEQQRGS